jgi:hypothetical protein|tara:strand:+ start:203 stop:406 length:204 start_codon:yes stop_codon:yes gene_type:complete
MTKTEAIEFFGSAARAGRACGASRQAVDQWARVPSDKQFLLALASGAEIVGGDLSVDADLLETASAA